MEIELVEAFYQEDIALYRIINTEQKIIDRLPAIEIDFSILNDAQKNYYCLQSSPGGSLGRLLNKAQIEGYLDHHATFADRFGGDFTFEGMRYLIQGYFRFGSSGAPYVVFDHNSGNFKVNAIQSEACPIQLSISNNKEGNFPLTLLLDANGKVLKKWVGKPEVTVEKWTAEIKAICDAHK